MTTQKKYYEYPQSIEIFPQVRITHYFYEGNEIKPKMWNFDQEDVKKYVVEFAIQDPSGKLDNEDEKKQYPVYTIKAFGRLAAEFARQYTGEGTPETAVIAEITAYKITKTRIPTQKEVMFANGDTYNKTENHYYSEYTLKDFKFLDRKAVFQKKENAPLLGGSTNTPETQNNDGEPHEFYQFQWYWKNNTSLELIKNY